MPDECGNMLSATAAADNWKAWLDDLPLPFTFDPAIGRLQDFITGLTARIEAQAGVRADTDAAAPVAWKYRWKIDGEYVGWRYSDASNAHPSLDGYEEVPLYDAPPAGVAKLEAVPVAAQCCMCGKGGLSTAEDGGPECELHDGRWVCSRDCWETASATPTDPGDGWTWNERLGWIGPDGNPLDPRRRG